VDPRITLVTLGVDDLPRARAFYAALGWQGQEVEETLFLRAGPLVLTLWSRTKLAADSGVPDDGRGTFDGVVLAQNVRSAAEVDAIVAAAADAGADVTRAPAPTFYGGYAGVFRDPDGHAWEIAFNPGFPLDADGMIVLPEF
jgi:predicted lactoylglutathione lyase